MGLGVRLSLSMRGLIGSKEEDHPTLRGLECSQGIEDDDAVLMCNERNTPVRGLTLQSDSMNDAPANMGWITCVEEASGFVGCACEHSINCQREVDSASGHPGMCDQ